MVSCFLKGDGINTSRILFYAVRWLTKHTNLELRLSHASLLGHRRKEHERTQDPECYESAVLKMDALMSDATTSNAKERARVAAAVLIGFDGYHRPGDAATVRTEDLHPPLPHQSGAGASWALTLFPQTRAARSTTGLQDNTFTIGGTNPRRR
jgi:hypothetical protein